MKSGNPPGLILLRLYALNKPRGLYGLDGFTEIVKPESLIPNGGLWYQSGDIQYHIDTENEVNTSKSAHFRGFRLYVAEQHLTRQGVILQEEIQIPGQIRFSFFDPFKNRIELLQKI
jgi:hypothetical protein